MVPTGSLKGQQAPCGQVVDVQRYEDRDEEARVTYEDVYACGCLSIRHEYHDGSFSQKVVHHNGHVLMDELLGSE